MVAMIPIVTITARPPTSSIPSTTSSVTALSNAPAAHVHSITAATVSGHVRLLSDRDDSTEEKEEAQARDPSPTIAPALASSSTSIWNSLSPLAPTLTSSLLLPDFVNSTAPPSVLPIPPAATSTASSPSLPIGSDKAYSADSREIGNEAYWTLSSAKQGNGIDQLRDDNLETFWQSDGSQPHIVSIHFLKVTRIQYVALYVDYKLDESYTPQRISLRAGTTTDDVKTLQVIHLHEPQGWVVIRCFPSDYDPQHPEDAEQEDDEIDEAGTTSQHNHKENKVSNDGIDEELDDDLSSIPMNLPFEDTNDQRLHAMTSKLYPKSLISLSKLSRWRKIPKSGGDPLKSKSNSTTASTPPPGHLLINAPCLRTRVLQIIVLSSHQNGRDTHVRQVKIIGPRQQQLQNRSTSDSLDEFSAPEFPTWIR